MTSVSIQDTEHADFFLFGHAMSPFGVKGEFKVYVYNPASPLLENTLSAVLIERSQLELIENQQIHSICFRKGAGKKIIARSSMIHSANDAALHDGKELWVSKEHLPTLEEGEWYHYQLLGMPVHDQQGTFVGAVVEIVQSTTDILIIDGDERHYVPFVGDQVISVSLQTGIVISPRNA